MTRAEEFEELRPLLFAIAYRILGSVSEAEDAVQESWLRYDASPTRPTSTKAFLSAVVTRISIDVLRSARVRREEAVWIPLGDDDFGVGYENPTSYPAPGQILLHPGSVSETEILLAYGGVRFASKVGQLAGNHFMTVVSGQENLPALGRLALWDGVQPIRFELSTP